MGEFYADPAAIGRFATATGNDGLAGDSSVAITYHSTWCKVPSDATGVVFQNFTALASDAFTAADVALGHLRTILRDSSTELTASANFYSTTDAERAAALDGTYKK